MTTDPPKKSPTSPSNPDDEGDGRVAPRKAVRIIVEVKISAGGGFTARVADLTPFGCSLLLNEAAMQAGQFITIENARIAPISGIVRWMRAGRAGVEFLRPLTDDLLQALRK